MPASMPGKLNPMYKHGMSRSPEYKAWDSMRDRCTNPSHPWYKRYGGRGIKICKRWDSFILFYRDMGKRPPKASLERRNNDGGYKPSNCTWAPRKSQSENRSTTIRVTVGGRTQSVSRWARERGMGMTTILWRLEHGWSADRAVLTPPRKLRRNS